MPLEQKPINAKPTPFDEAARPAIARRQLLFAAGGILLFGVNAATNSAGGNGGASIVIQRTGHPLPETPAATQGAHTPPAPARIPRVRAATPTTPPPPDQVAEAPQYYVDDAGPRAIALTLDDGPDPVYTPQVLDILNQYGVQATFDMIGEQVNDNLSLVREVSAAGHVIANHTWDHPDLSNYSTAQVLSEIDRCNDVLAEAGQVPRIFRAPYGNWSSSVFEACAVRGLTPLDWSVDPQDWDTENVGTADIVDTVLRETHRHDIILAHDGGGDRSNTVAALRVFIPRLIDRGYAFASV